MLGKKKLRYGIPLEEASIVHTITLNSFNILENENVKVLVRGVGGSRRVYKVPLRSSHLKMSH